MLIAVSASYELIINCVEQKCKLSTMDLRLVFAHLEKSVIFAPATEN